MRCQHIWALAAAASAVLATTTTSAASESYTVITDSALDEVTGSYAVYTDQITVTYSDEVPSSTSSSNATITGSTLSTSVAKGTTSYITELIGGVGQVTLTVVNHTTTFYPNLTTTRTSDTTSATATPTNTQPCNGWPEFCERKYGNVTEVAAHNAAFSISGNAASNQRYSITVQLDNGVRMRKYNDGRAHDQN